MFEEECVEYMGDVGGARMVTLSTYGMGALSYTPDLAPVGSGAAGTYYPRSTDDDAVALNYLGFFSDAELADHVGTNGSQKADIAASVGAWSPAFKRAVTAFQVAAKLTPDGWIGPSTRKRLAELVASKNAGQSVPVPVPVVPNVPGVLPSPTPAPAAPKSKTGLYLGIGGAAVGAGLLWYLLK